MKLRSFSSAAIVAALALGVIAPMTASAQDGDATKLDSQGKVIVTEGGDEEIPGTVDPEDPDTFLPEPDEESPGENTNEDLGALMIEKTTDLDFGTIKTSANTITQPALPMSFEDGAKTRGAYVQWRDIRSASAYGYTINAKMTQQFTGTTASNVLTSSTITYSNGLMAAQGDNENTAPSVAAPGFELELGQAKPVVEAKAATQEGKGRYVMEFGQSEDLNGAGNGTEGDSVVLTVPAATASNMALDTYTAIVEWSITAAP